MKATTVQYERLFNIGDFSHEKINVTVQLNGEKPEDVLTNLMVEVVSLEGDFQAYRKALQEATMYAAQIHHLREHIKDKAETNETHIYKTEIDKLTKKFDAVNSIVLAFEKKHKPLSVKCKCRFCQEGGDYRY